MATTFTETWGCQMIAYMLDAVLYGAASILVLQYFYSHTQHDSLRTRSMVGILWLFGSVQFIFVSHQVYTDFVVRFSQEALLDDIVFSGLVQLLAVYFTAFTAQMLFATQIWGLAPIGKKLMYTCPVLLLASLQIGFGIAQTVLSAHAGKFSLLSSTTRITSTQAGTTAACDTLITAILCVILNKKRSGFQRSERLIDKLILYTINRGAITSLCALLNLICFVAIPGTFIFLIPLDISAQFYVISVATMLVSRKSLQRDISGQLPTDSDIPLGSIRATPHTTIHVRQDMITWDDSNIDSNNALHGTKNDMLASDAA